MYSFRKWVPPVLVCALFSVMTPVFTSPAASIKDPRSAAEFQAGGKIGPFLARSLPVFSNQSARAKGQSVVHVVIRFKGEAAEIEAAVRAVGAEVEAISGELLQSHLTIDQIRRLARLDTVLAMRVPYYAAARGVDSAGVTATGASSLHSKGITGTGATVAVVDIGFDGYRSLAGSELPADVAVKNFNSDGFATTFHGSAVAEIVHDMAPGADIVLVAVGTDVEFMQALDWIAAQGGIDIINASIGFDNVGPLDGTSPITQAADRMLEDNGILFVNSAGNEQQDYYSARFSDPDGDDWHNFAGADEQISVQLNGAEPYDIVLNWDDWGSNPAKPASSQDYDLYLWCPGTSDFTVESACASSTAPQDGAPFDRPLEQISQDAPQGGEYQAGIKRNGAETRLLRLSFTGRAGSGSLEYQTRSSTLSLPADGKSVLAVGAFNIGDYNRDLLKNSRPTDFDYSINDWRLELPPEPYSSLGPTWDGRTKPELSAPDCVFTQTFGNGGFCGTSAAAPYVAGAAALLKSEAPERNGAALKRILIATAEDVRPQGLDNEHGAGRLSLVSAFLKPRISARSGLWVNPTQNGHGFYFDVRNNVMTILWYIYDRQGTPMWLLATGSINNGQFSESFYSYRTVESITSPLADFFDAAGSTVSPVPIGTVSVQFTGDADAMMHLEFTGDDLVAAADYQVALNQFLTYPAASDSGMPYASHYTGVWFSLEQNGHGFFILRQGFLPSPNLNRYPTDKIVVSWFGYDASGKPLWLQGTGPMDDAQSYFSAGKSIGTRELYRFSGPTVTGDFGLNQMFSASGIGIGFSQTGSFSIDFLNARQARIDFSAGGGINETLPVERLEF